MKKAGLPIVATATIMFAFGADSFVEKADETEALSPAARADAMLELSFIRLQQQALDDDLSADETRLRMAEWASENQQDIENAAMLRKSLRAEPLPVVDPGLPPVRAGKDPEEFLAAAVAYHDSLLKFTQAEASEDETEFRTLFAQRTDRADYRSMVAATEAATEELNEMELLQEPALEHEPLPELVTDKTVGQLAKDEIDALLRDLGDEAVETGGELRHRVVPHLAWIESKNQIVRSEQSAPSRSQQLAARVQFLEELVEERPE